MAICGVSGAQAKGSARFYYVYIWKNLSQPFATLREVVLGQLSTDSDAAAVVTDNRSSHHKIKTLSDLTLVSDQILSFA